MYIIRKQDIFTTFLYLYIILYDLQYPKIMRICMRYTMQFHYSIWKFAKLMQKFRQIDVFTKELYCKSIWRKNFQMGENFWNYHCVPNKYFYVKSILIGVQLIWRKFCNKVMAALSGNLQIFPPRLPKFRQINFFSK